MPVWEQRRMIAANAKIDHEDDKPTAPHSLIVRGPDCILVYFGREEFPD